MTNPTQPYSPFSLPGGGDKKNSSPPLDNSRNLWSRNQIQSLLEMPFPLLMFQAQERHQICFDPLKIQISSLLSIKSGGCSEDCAYCPQSSHHKDKPIKASKLMAVEEVVAKARQAKAAGARRFCMGAAWRAPKDHNIKTVCAMIEAVKKLGMETCVTIGMLTQKQAQQLRDSGLDYYNHNLDTSPDFYGNIITTRTYEDRLNTLTYIRDAGVNICCGGIIGMGENISDRADLIATLANLPKPPESVPINLLVKIEGTPLSSTKDIDIFDFIRVICATRISMPYSYIRLAAGRENMTDEAQALCFLAGANSIFYGEKLLTAPNSPQKHDAGLLERLGMHSSLQRE